MKYIAIFITSTLFFASAFAQGSQYSLLYKLTDAQAEEIYRSGEIEYKVAYFEHEIGKATKSQIPSLRHGHYLSVDVVGEKMQMQIYSRQSIQIVIVNNDRDLVFEVIDSFGNAIVDAQVTLYNKRILYDAKTALFRLKNWKKDGLLIIRAQGETAFFDLENENHKQRHRRSRRYGASPIIRIITAPYRFFHRGFAYDDWRFVLFPRRFRHRQMKGYIATNKPKYQPGDTVKIKAYVTKPNGRPWKKPMNMTIKDGRKVIVNKNIKPLSDGAYTYQLRLADSLRLDKSYSIECTVPGKRWGRLYHYFQYEDYELETTNYTWNECKKEYYLEEKIAFEVEGKDENGFTVPGITANIDVEVRGVKDIEPDDIYIPQKLWNRTMTLQNRGSTTIILPDSIFPPATVSALVTISLHNSRGETEQKNFYFTRHHTSENPLQIELKNGQVIATVRDTTQVLEEVQLTRYYHSGYKRTDTIQLPYTEKINRYVRSYVLHANRHQRISINNSAQVTLTGKLSDKKLALQFYNPHQIPVQYQVYTNNRMIHSGTFTDSVFHWLKSSTALSHYVKYQWTIGGASFSEQEEIRQYEKLLNVEIEGPQQIQPGQQTQMKIAVRTHKGQPVQGVNLTAGAVNMQFKNSNPFSTPSIKVKKTKQPKQKKNVTYSATQPRCSVLVDVNPEWIQKFELDTVLFYEMRYTEKPVFTYYDSSMTDSFHQEIAQFAPYVIHNHKALSIYMVYVNRELVYYHDVDGNQPYSFIGRPGRNTITVRTKYAEYTIANVLLKKGSKLEIAIHVDDIDPKQVRIRPMLPYLTNKEKTLLNNSIFVLKKNDRRFRNSYWYETLWVWDNAHHIHEVKTKWNTPYIKIGPFASGTNLNYGESHRFETQFQFEPGFSYIVNQGRERLYQHTLFPQRRGKKLIPPELKLLPVVVPGQYVYTPSDIELFSPQSSVIRYTHPKEKADSVGDYMFELPRDFDSTLAVIVLEVNDSTRYYYPPKTRDWKKLKAGKYKLFLFNRGHHYFQKEIMIQPDHIFFQRYDSVQWVKDNEGQLRKRIFYAENPLFLSFEQNKRREKTQHRNIEFQEGNLISGYLTDDSGEPLIGANVLIKGTNIGTVSDIDGYYQIVVPDGYANLVVSYTGYETQEITIGSNASIVNGVMHEGASLSEMVVTGYAGQPLRTKNIDALAGATAGISVRGSPTNATNYYLDGIRVFGASLSNEGNNHPFMHSLDTNSFSTIRSAFADYAFWQPNLITDKNGEAYFSVTYPDNITSWKTFALGMDKKSRAGTGFTHTRAYKSLLAQLAIPRFLIAGDTVEVVGNSMNLTQDSFTVQTYFKQNDVTLQSQQHFLKEAVIEKTMISAPTDADSVQFTYALEKGKYTDGEERDIAVLPIGAQETNGHFMVLENDTAFQLQFNNSKGAITIYAEDNILQDLLRDIQYLRKYPYGCNEQTASRLLALLMEKQIRAQLNQPFDGEKEIQQTVARLRKNQSANGSWGWWPGNSRNYWMTIYVLRALHNANEAGYYTQAFETGLRFITSQLEEMNAHDLLYTLYLLCDVTQNMDFTKHLTGMDTLDLSLQEQLTLTYIQQKQNLPSSLESLYVHRKQTLLGGYYWGQEHYSWRNNAIQNTMLAYKILRNANEKTSLPHIRQYFLERRSRDAHRRAYGWRNTFETAQILTTILPDIIQQAIDTSALKNILVINDNRIDSLPITLHLQNTDHIKVKKQGAGPLFFTAYQQWHNPAPDAKRGIFDILTQLQQEGQKGLSLIKGNTAQLIVTVRSKADADYVMLEVPVPAGCSYARNKARRNSYENHREYFRHKTAIFCEHLPAGTHRFTIALEPRFSGRYTLNPAVAEQMYFPVLYGRNGVKRVEIGE